MDNNSSILEKAERELGGNPLTITSFPYPDGCPNNYHSDASYWWPDPEKPDGLPFIRRDGFLYPGRFMAHKDLLLEIVHRSETLYKAFLITGDRKYSDGAVKALKTFFVTPETRMNPYLLYSQAIKGLCRGRSIGLIDTLQLVDIPLLLIAMKKNGAITESDFNAVAEWFTEYADWLYSGDFGKKELSEKNNHSITCALQLASFSLFSPRRDEIHKLCEIKIMKDYIPHQISSDGSMPEELHRTRPYSYSIFSLDSLVTLFQVLSYSGKDLWNIADGRGVGLRTAVDFLAPFLKNNCLWPYGHDVEGFERLPLSSSFPLFAGRAYNDRALLDLYDDLSVRKPENTAEDRNIPVKYPELYL